MKISKTQLEDAYIIELEEFSDERGFFARAFCEDEFKAAGIDPRCAQSNICLNRARGTIRGMHLQLPPRAEAKLVRCMRGAVLDVIIDLRPDSPTYLEHLAVELSDTNRLSLFVPPLFAHGYQTLEDGTELYYQMSEVYAPGFERGIRYDDRSVAVRWPLEPTLVSTKDRGWPEFTSGLQEELASLASAGAR